MTSDDQFLFSQVLFSKYMRHISVYTLQLSSELTESGRIFNIRYMYIYKLLINYCRYRLGRGCNKTYEISFMFQQAVQKTKIIRKPCCKLSLEIPQVLCMSPPLFALLTRTHATYLPLAMPCFLRLIQLISQAKVHADLSIFTS